MIKKPLTPGIFTMKAPNNIIPNCQHLASISTEDGAIRGVVTEGGSGNYVVFDVYYDGYLFYGVKNRLRMSETDVRDEIFVYRSDTLDGLEELVIGDFPWEIKPEKINYVIVAILIAKVNLYDNF